MKLTQSTQLLDAEKLKLHLYMHTFLFGDQARSNTECRSYTMQKAPCNPNLPPSFGQSLSPETMWNIFAMSPACDQQAYSVANENFYPTTVSPQPAQRHLRRRKTPTRPCVSTRGSSESYRVQAANLFFFLPLIHMVSSFPLLERVHMRPINTGF